jgi:hypothetical protein
VILRCFPKISGRGGDEALEGLSPWEGVSPSGRGLGAALSAGFATSLSAGVAVIVEDAPGAVIALVAAEVVGAASVVFDRRPRLGARLLREPVRLPMWAVRLWMHGLLLLLRWHAASSSEWWW